MGGLMLPRVNDLGNYQGENYNNHTYRMRNYTNRQAIKFVIDDITRNRENEKYKYQLLGYGAVGVNHFLSVEDMIATFRYVQLAYNIENRGGRRMYHEVFWFDPNEVMRLNWDIRLMWQFAYEVANEFFYKKGHQVIFAIHYDLNGKYHIHFAVNTINYLTGAKLHTYKNDVKERERACNVILEKYLNLAGPISKVIQPIYFGVYKGERKNEQ